MTRDLQILAIESPGDLVGRDPLELYRSLGERRGARQDPCVLDVVLSVTRFLAGKQPRPMNDKAPCAI
jgi:hypothetical protein